MRNDPPLGPDALESVPYTDSESDGRMHGRRTFASPVAAAGVGTLAGCAGSLSSSVTAEASSAVGPDATGLTDAERTDFVDRFRLHLSRS